jgi:hypothetical protein
LLIKLIVSQLAKNPSEFNKVCEFITVHITVHTFSTTNHVNKNPQSRSLNKIYL